MPAAEEFVTFEEVDVGDNVTISAGVNGDYAGRIISKGANTLVLDADGAHHRVFRGDTIRMNRRVAK